MEMNQANQMLSILWSLILHKSEIMVRDKKMFIKFCKRKKMTMKWTFRITTYIILVIKEDKLRKKKEEGIEKKQLRKALISKSLKMSERKNRREKEKRRKYKNLKFQNLHNSLPLE